MVQIVQCVPNISEGRRQDVIDAIVGVIPETQGVTLLDYSPDADHNRTVITFVGNLEGVKLAAKKLTAKAVELINMEEHQGDHPRIGAVDVIPFIPIEGVTMEECVQASRELAKQLQEELSLPTFLYAEASLIPARKSTAAIRKGQYEGLKTSITSPGRQPDFGEAKMHPTAGATMVGARLPLVAFNVNLGTDRLDVAEAIGKVIRQSGGGFMNVKGMGVELKERKQVQVSMNLENYMKTPIYRVFETVKREALRYGVPVVGCEIVGLVPSAALIDVAEWYLQLEDFKSTQVLENRLK